MFHSFWIKKSYINIINIFNACTSPSFMEILIYGKYGNMNTIAIYLIFKIPLIHLANTTNLIFSVHYICLCQFVPF